MKLKVNGIERQVETEWRKETLLTVLREHFGLTGSRFSCGIWPVWRLSCTYRWYTRH